MYLRKSLREILEKILQNSLRNFNILIYGETGTGKEVLAREIHKKLKIEGDFVPLDVSSIPETLFESELFGHKKGAFTDAREDKTGLIEIANNGTLFLDEVSNIPLNIQAKLLRFLETRRFRRLGEARERESNFLLISATNENLEKLVEEGKFRKDLYYRISDFKISLKPLREEKEEIENLIRDFLGEDIKFSKRAIEFLYCYPFYGNVRELERFCRYIKFLDKKEIDIEDFPQDMIEMWCKKEKLNDRKIKDIIECMNNKFLKIMIENYLNSGGNIEGLCEELKVKKRQLYNIFKSLNIKIPKNKLQ
ncbi:MAG: sigma 54-interacting transcriptional regulator [candidate division WOR-3 bacterium]